MLKKQILKVKNLSQKPKYVYEENSEIIFVDDKKIATEYVSVEIYEAKSRVIEFTKEEYPNIIIEYDKK